ncbi:hypothetical protein ACOMHN_065169 [Nucella lapillus]
MTEYCSVLVGESWDSDTSPNVVVEYVFEDGDGDIASESVKTHTRSHLSSLSGFSQQLQLVKVRQQQNDCDDTIIDSEHCRVTLQCKPVYNVSIAGVAVASEARMLEVYDGKDGTYLQTVRGRKDKEDSEADDSRVHFMCHCHLDKPLGAITVKFLSLGQRVSFEVAHIKVELQQAPPSSPGQSCVPGAIDMDKLRQDVHDMGDNVSDRAKAFLTTLENFQKNKRGAADDMRHLLLDKNAPEGMGHSMTGITTLLSMFAASSSARTAAQPSPLQDSRSAEGSMMNHMLTQMMSSLTVGGGGGGGVKEEEARGGGGGEMGGEAGMFRFLQSVCGQVSQQRAEEGEARGIASPDILQNTDNRSGGGVSASSSVEMESRVTAQVEAMVESRLSEVEQHIKQEVDERMDELETRMTGKLDAILALLQSQKPPS